MRRSGKVTELPTRVPESRDVRMALIASGCHSGSTMLDILLGNHSAISGSGEMNRLSLYADDRTCTCGTPISRCSYWSRVLNELARGAGRETLRWSECHTDVPPLEPVLELDDAANLRLVQDGPVPSRLIAALAERGIVLTPNATLTYGGVRDRKWRILDESNGRDFVVRHEEGRVKVYPALLVWKNATRKVPSPLEVAVAAGANRSLTWLGRVSNETEYLLKAARNSWRVAEAMAAVDGTQVVVDSSKSALRLKLLYISRPQDARVIHLVRDGRAVAASAIRRTGQNPATAARVWKRENQHLQLVLRSIPARQKLYVRYEDICEHSERELRRLCEFLGLWFEPSMLQLWDRPVHNVPGNPFLFKQRQDSIAKDDRWRRDLSAEQVAVIEGIAGRLNRALGYA